jgi:hypothetical protein
VSIVSMIETERERYVTYFEEVCLRARARNPATARELLISINDASLDYPYRYLRADLVERLDDGQYKYYEVWLDPPSEGQSRGFQVGSVALEIHPFSWCATQILMDGPFADIAGFEARVLAWIGVESEGEGRHSDSGAIHSVTPISVLGQYWTTTIDFGTAPANVMLDMLDYILNSSGARTVVVTGVSR